MTNHLEYYKVFYYVAKYRSLTVAAEHLAISQPAVSQSIKMLESAVGTSRFIVRRNPVFYPYFQRRAADGGGRTPGRICIGGI